MSQKKKPVPWHLRTADTLRPEQITKAHEDRARAIIETFSESGIMFDSLPAANNAKVTVKMLRDFSLVWKGKVIGTGKAASQGSMTTSSDIDIDIVMNDSATHKDVTEAMELVMKNNEELFVDFDIVICLRPAGIMRMNDKDIRTWILAILAQFHFRYGLEEPPPAMVKFLKQTFTPDEVNMIRDFYKSDGRRQSSGMFRAVVKEVGILMNQRLASAHNVIRLRCFQPESYIGTAALSHAAPMFFSNRKTLSFKQIVTAILENCVNYIATQKPKYMLRCLTAFEDMNERYPKAARMDEDVLKLSRLKLQHLKAKARKLTSDQLARCIPEALIQDFKGKGKCSTDACERVKNRMKKVSCCPSFQVAMLAMYCVTVCQQTNLEELVLKCFVPYLAC